MKRKLPWIVQNSKKQCLDFLKANEHCTSQHCYDKKTVSLYTAMAIISFLQLQCDLQCQAYLQNQNSMTRTLAIPATRLKALPSSLKYIQTSICLSSTDSFDNLKLFGNMFLTLLSVPGIDLKCLIKHVLRSYVTSKAKCYRVI